MGKFIVAVVAVLFSFASQALAAYPDRPIKLIVPWGAGGDTDSIYRVFAPLMQQSLGQPVVVTNVKGASGTVGEREAANASPDGYTLFAAHDSVHSTYFAGLTDIKYSQAFEPICLVSATPTVVTSSAKAPYKTFKEMVAYAKAHPDSVKVGASLGSTSQFSIALMAKAAGIKVKYVPYDGTAARMNALLGGHIDLADSNLTQFSKVKAGQLRFLGIMTEERNDQIPDVPTLKEMGYDVEYAVNRGIMAPKGTPKEIVQKLEEACRKAAHEPKFAESMKLLGTSVRFMDASQYAAFLKKDDVTNMELTKDLGLLKRE